MGLDDRLSDAQKLKDSFTALSQNFPLQYACALVFLLLTALIIACGVKSGIERVSFYLMPVLFLIFLALAVQSIFISGSKEGFAYLLKPDWKSLGFTADSFDAFRFGKVFSAALGQAFISLSLGYGMLLVYGSYVANKENIFSVSVLPSLKNFSVTFLATSFTTLPLDSSKDFSLLVMSRLTSTS